VGYKIIYGEEKTKKKWPRPFFLTVLFFAMFLGWCFRSWEQGREVLLDVFFREGAADAVNVLRERLSSGADLFDAVAAFCGDLFAKTGETFY